MMTAMFIRLAVGAIAAFMLFGCASGKDAAPLRSSVEQSKLATWAITASAARAKKAGIDEIVDVRLKAACAGKPAKLDPDTCDLLDAQAKAGVVVKRVEKVGEKWVRDAIQNPDAAPSSGIDLNELAEAAVHMGAAYYTGGASNLILK